MAKKLFICGDSFCFPDPEYGPCWVDLLDKKLVDVEIINLSSPGASNYLIYLQIDYALKNNCDYLIYHATSSVRHEFCIEDNPVDMDHIKRYWNPRDRKNKDLVTTSWLNPVRNTDDLLRKDSDFILKFFAKHVDMAVAINKNYIFIDYSLQKLSDSLPRENWAWSRGGFEHKNFSDSSDSWDFSKYQDRHCEINLWDDYDRSLARPFYHVTDIAIHQKVCDHYIKMLNL